MTKLPPAFLQAPIAHRGLHDVNDARPENSIAAIEAAIDHGYGIEIDLQLSRDRQAMVFHDYDMMRLTGVRGPIQQREARELAQIPLLGGDEGASTFGEILNLVAGRAPLLVELKDQHGQMGPTSGVLEQVVADNLQGYDGALALMSFNPHMVIRLAELLPDIPRGIVTSKFTLKSWPILRSDVRAHLRGIPDYDRAGACFISHEIKTLKMPRVTELKEQGAHVLCWTVKSPKQEAKARKIADNITFEGYLAPHPA